MRWNTIVSNVMRNIYNIMGILWFPSTAQILKSYGNTELNTPPVFWENKKWIHFDISFEISKYIPSVGEERNKRVILKPIVQKWAHLYWRISSESRAQLPLVTAALNVPDLHEATRYAGTHVRTLRTHWTAHSNQQKIQTSCNLK